MKRIKNCPWPEKLVFFSFPFFVIIILCFFTSFSLEAQEEKITLTYYQTYFYLPQEVRSRSGFFDVEGFLLKREIEKKWNSTYVILTGFEKSIHQTRILKDINSPTEARKYFHDHTTFHEYMGIRIKELKIPLKEEGFAQLFWVGHQAYETLEAAQANLVAVKEAMERAGLSFQEAVKASPEFIPEAEKPEAKAKPTEKPNFQKEEDLAFKFFSWLGIGEEIYGRLQADAWGEPILYQATGETTYRFTNLDKRSFDDQVGYFSHKLVFKGIKFFFNSTLDPYIEAVPTLETHGKDYSSYLDLYGGVQYYPFMRSAFLQNFYLGKYQVLDWARNFRFFVAYGDRRPLKGAWDARHSDLQAGVDIFKEYGIDLPRIEEISGKKFIWGNTNDLLWGELYGEYQFEKNNFSSTDDFDSFLATTEIKAGLKWPVISLPDNAITDRITFMPYVIANSVSNSDWSNFWQNRYYMGAGLRIMPFRTYLWANNEWMFKTKLFIEYIGIGDIHYTKAKPASEVPEKDVRAGINISLRRF